MKLPPRSKVNFELFPSNGIGMISWSQICAKGQLPSRGASESYDTVFTCQTFTLQYSPQIRTYCIHGEQSIYSPLSIWLPVIPCTALSVDFRQAVWKAISPQVKTSSADMSVGTASAPLPGQFWADWNNHTHLVTIVCVHVTLLTQLLSWCGGTCMLDGWGARSMNNAGFIEKHENMLFMSCLGIRFQRIPACPHTVLLQVIWDLCLFFLSPSYQHASTESAFLTVPCRALLATLQAVLSIWPFPPLLRLVVRIN